MTNGRRLLSLLLISMAGCTAGEIVGRVQQSGQSGDNGDDGVPDAGAATDAGPATPDAPPQGGDPPATFDVTDLSRDDVISIARASVGYTYWWGHGALGGTQAGTCTGTCPNCSHTGAHGADCSGLVGKAWMLPEAMPIVDRDVHPFSTYDFKNSSVHWTSVPRSDIQRGDAMVYNQNGSGHVFVYEKDDPWGSMWTYEARGCAYGIVHNIRTASSLFGAIRRNGL
jgi:hypothetical protein